MRIERLCMFAPFLLREKQLAGRFVALFFVVTVALGTGGAGLSAELLASGKTDEGDAVVAFDPVEVLPLVSVEEAASDPAVVSVASDLVAQAVYDPETLEMPVEDQSAQDGMDMTFDPVEVLPSVVEVLPTVNEEETAVQAVITALPDPAAAGNEAAVSEPPVEDRIVQDEVAIADDPVEALPSVVEVPSPVIEEEAAVQAVMPAAADHPVVSDTSDSETSEVAVEEGPAEIPGVALAKDLDSGVEESWEDDGVREYFSNGYSRLVLPDVLSQQDSMRYRYSTLLDPPRLVVDVMDPQHTFIFDSVELKGGVFRQMRVGRYPDKVRLVFDLRDDDQPEPFVQPDGNDLIIESGIPLDLRRGTIAMGGPEEALAEEPPEAEVTAEKPVQPVIVAKADWKSVRVKGVDFEQTEATSDVIIATDVQGPYDVTEDGSKIVLSVAGAEIPDYLQRPIDTSGFPTAILSITPTQVGSGPEGQVRIAVLLRNKESYDVIRDGDSIRIRVQRPETPPEIPKLPPPTIPPETMASAPAQKEVPLAAAAVSAEVDTKAKPLAKAVAEKPVEVKKRPAPVEKKVLSELARREYTGKKISLDFKDADIQNVLRLIAEVSALNIVISDAVQGKVTIRLKGIPWDMALDVILKTYGLDKEELTPNVLRVAPYAQLKKEREAALKAEMALREVEKLITKVVPINYAKAGKLQPVLAKVRSTRGDASIQVDVRTNSLILKDLPKTVSEMLKLVERLDTQTPQVLIEAKIVELDVQYENELGIQWGAMYKADPTTGNPIGLNFPYSGSIGGAGSNINPTMAHGGIANPVVNLPAAIDATTGGAIGFSLASITNSLKLDAQLSALEKRKHARVLSSPRVATLNNQEARIEQGTEVPYQTTSDEGTKTEFKDAMLRLFVTPQINFDRSIIMKIIVSNDTPIKDATVGYIIQKKEAATSVLVNSGQTAVIGGIYTDNDQNVKGGVPFFQDIPGVGVMFRKNGKQKNRTELVIFITPRIISSKHMVGEEWVQ